METSEIHCAEQAAVLWLLCLACENCGDDGSVLCCCVKDT